jgi:DNA-binding CsgD family transcriptional regulator
VATEAAVLVAEALFATVDADSATALRLLVEAADLVEARPDVVAGESPHALGATVATLSGDLGLAADLLERAIQHGVGGPHLLGRHQVHLAWVALRAGEWGRARATLEGLRSEGTAAPLGPRAALVATATEVGLSRRAGDVAGLGRAWDDAEPQLARHQPSLLTLEPVLELAIAGHRLGHPERSGDALVALDQVVDELGAPTLWALALRWGRFQAAVSADDGSGAIQAAPPVVAVTDPPPRLGGLAPAARAWIDVLDGGTLDRDAVEAAADGLVAAGLVWEASRLVGQAAIRVDDSQAARGLLETARDLKARLPGAAAVDESAVPEPTVLSEREQEVGRYVADGLTHKEIGALLYISPKTVEHHVAKIRQKLGATTRAEMLAALQQL